MRRLRTLLARRPDAGFSLLELLVALGILAALAAIAIPATLAQRGAGADAAQKQDLTAAAAKIDALLDRWNGRPSATVTITTNTSTNTWTATRTSTAVATGQVTANTNLTGTVWTDGSYALLSTRTGATGWLYRSDTDQITSASALPTSPLGIDGTAPTSQDATTVAAPTTVTATSPTAGTVTVTWTAVTGATGYIARVDGAAPTTVTAGTLTATFTGIPSGTVTATVNALNGTAQSPGATATVTVTAQTTTVDTRPVWHSLALANGWVNFTEANQTTASQINDAAYTKVGGIVKVQGLIDSTASTVIAAGTVIGTLPPGYRPDYQLTFPATVSDAQSAIRVNTNGTITIVFAPIAGDWISLDNIIFPAAGVATWTQVGAAGSGSAFANGYASVGTTGSVTGPARYWKDPDGLVWLGGQVLDTDATVSTDNTNIFTLPTTHCSWLELHLRAVGTAATPTTARYATVGARTTDGINWKAGSPTGTNPISLDGVILVTADARNNLVWTDFGTYTGTTVWTNYNTTRFPAGGYAVTSTGMVILQGLLGVGTIGVPIQYLPWELATLGRQVRTAVSNNAHATLGINWGQGATAIAPRSGATWFSLDGHAWFPGG